MDKIVVKYRIFPILVVLFISTLLVISPFLPEPTRKPRRGREVLGRLISSFVREILSISACLSYFLLSIWAIIWSPIIIFHIYKLFNRTAFIASSEGIWVHFYGFISWDSIIQISSGETKYYLRGKTKFEPFITMTIIKPSQNIKPITIDDKLRACIFSFPSQITLSHLNKEPKVLIKLFHGMRRSHRSST